MLETLRFADEVRKAAPYFSSVADEEPDEELLGLALELIERKSGPFDPAKFKDSYTEAVRELIDAKAKHKKVTIEEAEAPSGGGKVIDLAEALKRSVRGAKRGASSGGSQRKKAG
jgi:DNA end-binding protein Ku